MEHLSSGRPQSAAKGNPAEMVRMVNQLMQSPDGAALIDRINKTMNAGNGKYRKGADRRWRNSTIN